MSVLFARAVVVPGRHREGWAYETAYEGALEGGPRCGEFMTRPS
jgi:hypothetical protein